MRIVAASNTDLREQVRRGEFRADLQARCSPRRTAAAARAPATSICWCPIC
ncbi:sigma 54-interacting transcriptional regulator [Variovorax sp. CF079]|uniref:sigma 54-interacting transcriptional regulator n=1 Tax=Variovorax sp. CF079 TaxID=1882774 RepID=UPI001113EC67